MAFFLSKAALRKWEGLFLRGCAIGDYGVFILHQYLCGTRARKFEIKTINVSNNNLTGAILPFIGDVITYTFNHIG